MCVSFARRLAERSIGGLAMLRATVVSRVGPCVNFLVFVCVGCHTFCANSFITHNRLMSARPFMPQHLGDVGGDAVAVGVVAAGATVVLTVDRSAPNLA